MIVLDVFETAPNDTSAVVGFTITVRTVPLALHTMFSFLSPAVAALKVNPYLQVPFASTAPVQVVVVVSGAKSEPLGVQERPVSAPVAVTVTIIAAL